MKKLTGFLCAMVLAFGVIGTANSATLNMIAETLYAYVGPSVTSEYNFTIEVAADGETVLGWTDFMSNQFFTEEAGGYDPRDGGAFAGGEQIYPNGVYQDASTAFDGNTAGSTLWFRGLSNSNGPFKGLVFNVGLLGLTYDKVTETGTMVFGPNMDLGETYYIRAAPFQPVPIPSAIWLLGSGLIGFMGFRKFRKEV